MNTEHLDIFDENDNPLWIMKSRDEIHRELKDWHRIVSVWIINDKNEFLCQKRSMKKDAHPGVWQSFFGGHLKAGQTYEECLKEELMEEIWIDITKLTEQPVFIHSSKWEPNRHHGKTYLLKWNGSLIDLAFDDWEVDEVKWLNFEVLQSKIDAWEFCNTINTRVIDFIKSV